MYPANPFPHVFAIYHGILKMKDQYPNDQDLGKAVRQYLNDFREGKILQGHPGIELDGIEEQEEQEEK